MQLSSSSVQVPNPRPKKSQGWSLGPDQVWKIQNPISLDWGWPQQAEIADGADVNWNRQIFTAWNLNFRLRCLLLLAARTYNQLNNKLLFNIRQIRPHSQLVVWHNSHMTQQPPPHPYFLLEHSFILLLQQKNNNASKKVLEWSPWPGGQQEQGHGVVLNS